MADAVDRSRRALLTGRIPGESANPPPQPALGPGLPWLAGRLSPATCTACSQPCVPACPESIVTLHPAEHSLAGLAYLDFGAGPCTFCQRCVEVCPEAPADPFRGRALAPVAVDSSRCLAALGVVCVICVARCPERALAGGASGHIGVNSDACTGCGACIPACPADALAVPAQQAPPNG